jgi:putative transposase
MYEYRKLTPEERAELVAQRRARGYPPHQPPHPLRGEGYYLLTAACYEHRRHINLPDRRDAILDDLFACFIEEGMTLSAWVVLDNHYHLLAYVTEFSLLEKTFRLVHGRSARQWNSEDSVSGRKVWYRYTDRMIRSERHYYATLNYIHYNPVKHGLVRSPYDWQWSSVQWYRENFGREWLRDLWERYPVRDYGKEWDE